MTPERKTARPLPNRVDPFGALNAAPERGAMMGNRGGRIHRDDATLATRRWASRRWIVCLCEFKGRRRQVWGSGYTELFFLDEPTALAAGHRPCFECRRGAAQALLAAFPGGPRSADVIDAVLHAERLDRRAKRLWRARVGSLPDGAMVAKGGRAFALRGGKALSWSLAGYGAPEPFAPGEEADVLTPPSTVAALAAGYRPLWTGSAA
jgi:hypothetical protein